MEFIKLFEEINANDVDSVGGKNASLGEMIQKLSTQDVKIPSGFATTAQAYRLHLEKNNLTKPLEELLDTIDKTDLQKFAEIGQKIRTLISSAPLPAVLVANITTAYKQLEERYGVNCDVAVRSSATAEDLPDASFAGQQETYLNVKGVNQLLEVIPHAFASLFTNRAISYRIDHNFDHLSVALSVGVQKMIRSDLAAAGVMFTLDTESGFKDVVFINGNYGLGESVVQGSINPDEFYVHKPTLAKKFKPLLKKRLGTKKEKVIYHDKLTQTVPVEPKDQERFCISDDQVLELARQALIIEDHYSKLKGSWCPMDIEWALDGTDGQLYIVQARPETVHSLKQEDTVLREFVLSNKPSDDLILATGSSIGSKIATGTARVIDSASAMHELKKGEILITDMTDPDWEPIMKIAGGIVTNRGGRTCHAAIVSRELGVPALVGTHNATEKIHSKQEVTLDCSQGETGYVYKGALAFDIQEIETKGLKKPPVQIMVNMGNPDQAFRTAMLPNEGVGLARLEFIINAIQVHPLALLHLDKVTNKKERAAIEKLTVEYQDKKQYFIDRLAQEAGTIAAAFYPRPVIIRMSDFKSNEYRALLGGSAFEPIEENAMIGFRGASRYYHEIYKDAFELECQAMIKIRSTMGLTNVKLMLPFVRTPEEGKRVVKLMEQFGLKRGENGLEIYMMVEIPSNVLLIDKFAQIFDGFSIGSNDLTQTTLAVDRDSALVAPIFDERNEAVKIMLKMAIEGAKRNNKKIGICGQAPSDYPELAQFLIDLGIDSLSLSPDSILKEIIRYNQ